MAKSAPGSDFASTIGGDEATRDGVASASRDEAGAIAGTRVGRLLLLRVLGAGAMGVVHAAYDEVLDRRVAIKFIHAERATSEVARQRLLREARAMARVSHPNVVHVYDAGQHDAQLFVAMEYVAGSTLRSWMDANTHRDWRAVAAMFAAIASGLAAAHAAGVVHRDFKPDNVLVTDDGIPKVADFGLAELGELSASETSTIDESTIRSAELTRTGAIVGTPVYLAPERFRGEPADAKSDQFAFCVALWEALYGERPFADDDVATHAAAVLQGQRRAPPSDRAAPRWLRRIVERGLATDPARRWPEMSALADALARVPGRRRRAWLLGAVAILVPAAIATARLRPNETAACTGARELMSRSWNDARRDELRAAMFASPVKHASTTWDRVEPRLRAWSQAWIDAHTEVCEATVVRREQSETVMDLRIACLHRAAQSFTAVTSVLAHADESTIDHADDVLDGLAAIEACDDVTALQSGVVPATAAERDAVASARERVELADALRRAGRLREAVTELETAERDLADCSYAPVHAELALERGRLHVDREEPVVAETSTRRALELALQSNDRALAREAALFLIRIVGYEHDRYGEALTLVDVVRGLSNQTLESEQDLHVVLGAVYNAGGHHDEAISHYRRALALAEQRQAPELDVQMRRLELAHALTEHGHVDEASTIANPAIEALARELGPLHPKTLDARTNQAIGLVHRGQYVEAEAIFRDVLAAREPGDPTGAEVQSALGVALMRQGKAADAIVELRHAIAKLERTRGPEHPRIARARGNLGQALLENGEHDAAIAENRAALQIMLASLDADHPDVVGARNNLGSILHAIGRHEEALAEHRACAEARSKILGPDHPDTATSRYNIAVVSMALGQYAEAEAQARRALESFRATLGEEHRLTHGCRFLIGDALREQGRTAEAIEWLELALSGQDKDGMPPRRAGDTAARLAEALWAGGDKARAREIAARAVALYTRAGPPSADRLALVQAWLQSH